MSGVIVLPRISMLSSLAYFHCSASIRFSFTCSLKSIDASPTIPFFYFGTCREFLISSSLAENFSPLIHLLSCSFLPPMKREYFMTSCGILLIKHPAKLSLYIVHDARIIPCFLYCTERTRKLSS